MDFSSLSFASIFSLAVYGPLIGAIIVKLLFKDNSNSINIGNTMNKKWGINRKMLLFADTICISMFHKRNRGIWMERSIAALSMHGEIQ